MSSHDKFQETEIGFIPKSWDFLKIKDIKSNEKRSVITGPFGSNISSKFFVDEGIPVIRGNNLTNDLNRFKDEGFVFITSEKADELKAWALSEDIIITAAGTLGQVGIIEEGSKFEKYVISNKQMRLRVNKNILNPLFAFYWLTSPWMAELIKKLDTGSTIPLINLSVLRMLPIPVPSMDEQKGIVDILDTLDSKIKINKKMNQTLEEIGQAIFKHWFVHFEFHNEEGKPYKSNGGEMVNSELGEIPKGWEVGKISDFGKVICGKTPPKSKSEFFDGKVPFIKIPDMHGRTYVIKTEDSLTNEGMLYQTNKTIPKNSVCVSCIATVGLVCLTDRDSQTNQQINSIVPKKEEYGYYLYYMLNSMKEFIEIMASGGSATLNLNTTNFSNIEILIPDEKILKQFKEICEPLFGKIRLNSHQNENLSKIRDSLLPKLMTGKIRFSGETK